MSNYWATMILVVHVLVALIIIVLVLLQHGKGADVGAAFGSGSSGSLFGATGSANFLSRATAALATVFFLTSLALAYVATNKPRETSGVMNAVKDAPAAPASSVPGQAGGDAAKAQAGSAPSPYTKSEDSRTNEVPK